ncbi:MAG: hypothetical protein COV74_09685 [Candidatus Omnitrophica bacterium CG11_big_fil_rev_8_21_14_0_20_45_26]|uniref:Xylose isomerase-like TIM barrel domain-containing protein n=1 Tax=Candidatus Abzuiibacterium crystallinum TaxID=1974748 RepID=A0A2H0LLD5_9BACT|nr:MAG: hypothetical protein COV74_09685 [Candidatus Omnitrophica bacterium CG11_big_fil_rev_8_21_14_0_20_45_26]PIW64479.1 MAG: hypothetical protein COW12_05810 [Candidatus Omnitrophica bacterium CG12_big_fil_rev_8_21_14_0_65_45_16]
MSKPQNEIYVSTACLDSSTRDLRHVIDVYQKMGIAHIEISAPHPYLSLQDLAKLIQSYQAEGVKFIFHNYFPAPEKSIVLNMISRDPLRYQASSSLIGNAVKLGRKTGVNLYCFHPGYLRDGSERQDGMFEFYGKDDQGRRAGLEYFMSTFPKFYHQLNVESNGQSFFIGLENLFPSPNGQDQSILCTADEFERVFESPLFKESNIGILIDLAHLTIASSLYGFDRDDFLDRLISQYGDRIYEVHLSENDGRHDSHWTLRKDSWCLNVLKRFRQTGTRLHGELTKICIEPRKLNEQQIKDCYELVKDYVS